MKQTCLMLKAVLFGVLVLLFAAPVAVHAINYGIVSSTFWTVSDINGMPLGNAQTVCLNATSPSNCPPGATLMDYPFAGWFADISGTPGALWIWAPNITGESTGAENAEFVFETQFFICGAPQGGTVSVAADNSAEVIINGTSVLTNMDQSALSTVSIPSMSIPLSVLNQGPNTIQIKAKNAANPGDCGTNKYKCNPAGVVFGASFSDGISQRPTCNANNGLMVPIGTIETSACPVGQNGSRGRVCACFGSSGFWFPFNSCMTAPATCTKNDGTTVGAGGVEQVACPAPRTGSQTRTCQSNGSWGPLTGTCQEPPPLPVRCAGTNGAMFNVGQVESLACPAGRVGSRNRTCQGNGTWSAITEACRLPDAGVGELCGSRNDGVTRNCPAGTTCGSRLGPPPPKTFLCAFLGIDCRPRLQTTDWFCDAP